MTNPTDDNERDQRANDPLPRERRDKAKRPVVDPVIEASEESFPASDAPSWSNTHLGTPDDA